MYMAARYRSLHTRNKVIRHNDMKCNNQNASVNRIQSAHELYPELMMVICTDVDRKLVSNMENKYSMNIVSWPERRHP